VHNNIFPTDKRQIQQAEKPTHIDVISAEAARVGNTIRLDNWTSKVAGEDPEIRSTNPDIPNGYNLKDDKWLSGMAVSFKDDHNNGDEIDEGNAIPSVSRRRRAATGLQRFVVGTSDFD